MSRTALFVDLPNFYSSLLESKLEQPRFLRDYFLNWFDFDRLAFFLTKDFSNTWIFYSGRRFGPKENRIQDTHLDEFIARINSQKGVTAWDVNIPGDQREAVKIKCENCGTESHGQWESEKGIDASLTVHLFDTEDTWDTAFLLSGDADFVPAVRALRRRGKVVIGTGFGKISSALKRECYDMFDLRDNYLKEDVVAYSIFKDDGIIDYWLNCEVESLSENIDEIKLSFAYGIAGNQSGDYWRTIHLNAEGPIKMDKRTQKIEKFKSLFPNNVSYSNTKGDNLFNLSISEGVWQKINKKLDNSEFNYLNKTNCSKSYNSWAQASYQIAYIFNVEQNKYIPGLPDSED